MGAGKDGRYFLLAEQIACVTKGTPCIHDVVNEQHRAVRKVKLGLADEAQGTPAFSPEAVAAQPIKTQRPDCSQSDGTNG